MRVGLRMYVYASSPCAQVRVLRAVRLLRKSKHLRPIVEALFASVAPVLNSMVLFSLSRLSESCVCVCVCVCARARAFV